MQFVDILPTPDSRLPTLLGFGVSQLPMLWWLAAAAAPLLVHLLSRRRYREVPWAAAEYLLAALKQSARRLQAEHWILMAMRMAIIVLVVIAVAGPYWRQAVDVLPIGQPMHKVLVIDGSFSMLYKPGETSRFDHAKQWARDIIAHSTQGDAFSLVLMASPSRTIVAGPAFVSDQSRQLLSRLASNSRPSPEELRQLDNDDFLKQIDDLVCPHGGGDVAGAIDCVREVIDEGQKQYPRLAGAEVYFITDLGRTSWDLNKVTGGRAARKQIVKLAETARLSVVDVGEERCENLAVTSLNSPERLFTVRRPIELTIGVQNFGAEPHRARVELLVDGERAQERTVDLPPRAQQSLTFAQQFDAPGDHVVEGALSTDSSDALEVDNHRWLSVPVKQTLQALVVNGEGAQENARYLVSALDPYRDGSSPLPVEVEQIGDGRLLEVDLRRYDCVMLSDVGQFTPAEARLLADYAQSGGGLVFFLGGRVDAENYNLELGGERNSAPRLLPARLDRPADAAQYSFDPLEYKDPIVREFRGNERAGLLSTAITRYFRLKPVKPTGHEAAPVAALEIGGVKDPAIISWSVAGKEAEEKGAGQREVGQKEVSQTGGRVVMVALPASFASVDPATKEPWSNWPIKNSFPPIVQNLLLSAAPATGADRNLTVGRPIQAALAAAPASNLVTIEDPARRREQIRVAAREAGSRWSYNSTWQSGVYRAMTAGAAAPQLYAVNVDPAESDLAKLDPRELPSQISVVSADRGADGSAATDIGARSGQQRTFLLAALALLLLETVVAWYFDRRAA